MKLHLVLFATLAVASSIRYKYQQSAQNRQNNEYQESPSSIGNQKMSIFTTRDQQNYEEKRQLDDLGSINRSIAEHFPLGSMNQFGNNHESKGEDRDRSNTPKSIKAQTSRKSDEGHLQSSETKRGSQFHPRMQILNLKKEAQDVTGRILADKQAQKQDNKSIQMNKDISESSNTKSNMPRTQDRQKNMKSRIKIHYESPKKYSQREEVRRERRVLRIEADSQDDSDSILKIYYDLKEKKQSAIRKKRELIQQYRIEQNYENSERGKENDILFYSLLALLSLVTAAPLIRMLFTVNKEARQAVQTIDCQKQDQMMHSPSQTKLDLSS